MRLQWRIHKLIWNVSGGRLGRHGGKMPVLKLAATGHSSGELREVLLWYADLEGGPALTGTNAGADYEPAWIKNLRAHPHATMTKDGVTSDVTGVFLEGQDHSEAWGAFTSAHRGYADYETALSRPIPIVQLVPRRETPR